MGEIMVTDTEADGLLNTLTKFHCLVFSNIKMSNWVIFCNKEDLSDEEIKAIDEKYSPSWYRIDQFKQWLKTGQASALVCHNIAGYDLPVMKKMGLINEYDVFPDHIDGIPIGLYDTLDMSRVLHPDRQLPKGCPTSIYNPVTKKKDKVGPHGLMSWGYRVAKMKPVIHDWRNQSLYTYLSRCIDDVEINIGTWLALLKEAGKKAIGAKNGWWDALKLSKESHFSMCKQEITGVPFREAEGWKLVTYIDGLMKEIAEDIEPQLPPRVLPKGKQYTYPAAPFTGEGQVSAAGWNWLKKLGYSLNEEAFNKIKYPNNPFKNDGTYSVAGLKYMEDNKLSTNEDLLSSIEDAKIQNAIQPLEGDELIAAMDELRSEKVPILTEPMKLSNQYDIKVWLYSVGGWKPTEWGTKDATRREKVELPKSEVRVALLKYIDEVKGKPWKHNIYKELGINFDLLSTEKALDKLDRKARYLVTSPKFKDERGNLCPNLEMLNGKLAAQIVKWLSLRNRRTTLLPLDDDKTTGWLKNPRLAVDGRLPAGSSGSTNTCRKKHRVVVNVPKADPKVLLGKEFRGLFFAPEGMLMVGWDGSALEQRVACHYAWKYDDGWYYYESMGEGVDYHEKMAAVYRQYAPEVTRSSGKNVSYGILYGCQAGKLSNMLGISLKQAQALLDGFWETNWSLKKLKDNLEKYWEKTGKRYILGIDGRKIYTRSKHSLLNCLFQSTGACVMDKANALMRYKIREEGLEHLEERVLFQHDESQHLVVEDSVEVIYFEVDTDDKDEAKLQAQNFTDGSGRILSNPIKIDGRKYKKYYSRIGEIASESILAAGEALGMALPITASYDIGNSWAETH